MLRCLPSLGTKSRVLEKGNTVCLAEALEEKQSPTGVKAVEKEMATHSSVLAWRIPGLEEPGGLPSVGSHRVGHD